jgi:hypothetical protein
MGQFEFFTGKPGKEKDEIGLDDQRNGGQQNDEGIADDVGSLKGEKKHQSGQQRYNADGF